MKQCLLEHVITEVPSDCWAHLWRAAFISLGDVVRFTPPRGQLSVAVVVHAQVRGFIIWPLVEERALGSSVLLWKTCSQDALECTRWQICNDFGQLEVLVVELAFDNTFGIHYLEHGAQTLLTCSAERAFHGTTVPVLKELAEDLACPRPWPRARAPIVEMLLKQLGHSPERIAAIMTTDATAAASGQRGCSAEQLPPEVLAHLSEEELQHLNVKPPSHSAPAAAARIAEPSHAASSAKARGPQILPEQQVWDEIRCEACGQVFFRVKTNPTHPAGAREEARMLHSDGTFPIQVRAC